MTPPDPPRKLLTALYVLAAAGSLYLGAAPHLGVPCDACKGGVLSLALPWAGLVFYGTLAVVAARAPLSRGLALAPGFYLFVHATLVTEMILTRRICIGCLVVAAAAAGAALVQVLRPPREWISAAAALVLGIVAAFLTPVDRVDELLTRTFWPAKLLELAPDWVPREEMTHCEHDRPVRLLIYEKDCKACGSAAKRILPRLTGDFPTQVCVHVTEMSELPKGQRLPFFIVVSKRSQVVMIEGMPEYSELQEIIRSFLKSSGPAAP